LLRELKGLRRVREARVLTQRQLADSAGLTQAAIARLEKGGTKARPTTIQRLAKALLVSPEELIYKEGAVVPLGRPQQAAVELAQILERDTQGARMIGSEELRESVLVRASKAYLKLRELRDRGEDVPDWVLSRYDAIISVCLDDAKPKVRNKRADALLREIEEPVSA
jgi:transcriptional regulator with XRE-family HTH domain